MGRRGNNDSPDIRLSKALSRVLRHKAAEDGLNLAPDGYAKVDDLLALQRFKSSKTSLEDLERILKDNDKQRFSMKQIDGVHYIRANQGHTIQVDDLELLPLQKVADFPTGMAIHGTTKKAWDSGINQTGLSRMSRNHIHMAVGLPGDKGVISGMRKSAASQVLIYIDIDRALQASIPFFLSANGVILSPGNENGYIPREFFLDVKGVDIDNES